MTEPRELLPCPFCGNPAIDRVEWVHCSAKDRHCIGIPKHIWNTRPKPTSPRAREEIIAKFDSGLEKTNFTNSMKIVASQILESVLDDIWQTKPTETLVELDTKQLAIFIDKVYELSEGNVGSYLESEQLAKAICREFGTKKVKVPERKKESPHDTHTMDDDWCYNCNKIIDEGEYPVGNNKWNACIDEFYRLNPHLNGEREGK